MGFSNLPRDLMEEIFFKLSVTSLRAMRLTCKNWSKNIITKEASRESMVMIVMDYKVYLMDINLHDPSSLKRKGKLISLEGLDDQVPDISQIFHCDGLLLCVTNNDNKNKKLTVWNPYSGKTRWIKPTNYYNMWDRYAIGYEKKNSSCSVHKILRFYDDYVKTFRGEIYVLKTNSWRVLDMTPPEWYLCYCRVSLKGNTYWIATGKIKMAGEEELFLICFDFTYENFGPRLSLPFKSYFGDVVVLSSVREDQLAVLIQRRWTLEMEIWVTSNIEPKTVSWSKLFDTKPFIHRRYQFSIKSGSFFIDEEKKVVVVIDRNEDNTRHIAYIIGETVYIRQVDLGQVTNKYSRPSYYVHIKKPRRKHIIF